AEEIAGGPVAFELSVVNVDKPPLGAADVRHRFAQFRGRARVELTRAPTFLQKSRLLPGATFVVGADTAERLVAGRYYDNDERPSDHDVVEARVPRLDVFQVGDDVARRSAEPAAIADAVFETGRGG